jgi:hypothetical protein
MIIRIFRAPAMIAAVLGASLLAASPASAAPASCSVLGLTPETISVGADLETPVIFDVATDCPEDSVVNWYLSFSRSDATGPHTGPILTNVPQPHPTRPIYTPGGVYTWKVTQYQAARYNVTVNAFIGDGAYKTTLPRVTLPVTVVESATAGTS